MRLRIAFMGSPEIAARVLSALVSAGHDIAAVYSQPARPSGRGQRLSPTPVAAFAGARGFDVRTPKHLKSEAERAAFAALDLDVAVVVAYGLILPPPILSSPRLGCLNLHASILPRWRGAAPIQRAIMAGDTETGIDAMMMEAGLDTGPVLASVRTPITDADTAESLHDRLATLAANLGPVAVAGLASGALQPRPQPGAGVTYAHKLSPNDQLIDWTRPAAEIDCQVRGLAPFPGAIAHFTPPGETVPQRLKFLFSAVSDTQTAAAPGTLIDGALTAACGDGRAVKLLRLQAPGGKPLDAAAFLNGRPMPAGLRLY
jgi:methionyl-tRNA formyltransferase